MVHRLWSITEFPYEPQKQHFYETIFSIGNGYLGTRASFEERLDGDQPSTLVHGIYNHAPGVLVPELVNAPNWLDIRLTVDGTPFKMVTKADDYQRPSNGLVLGYRRTLHMNCGLLQREVLFRAASGSVVRVVFERFTSLSDVHKMAQRVTVTAVDGSPEIVLESALDADVSNNGARHWTDVKAITDGGMIALEARTAQSGYVMGMASCLIARSPIEAKTDSELRPSMVTRFHLTQEESATVDKLTAVYTSRDVENPLEMAQENARGAAEIGYDTLLTAHEITWEKTWETSDVVIEGDDDSQVTIRFTQYHILIAAPRHSDTVSIGAKTLSGLGYKGHVFWDTELFILPPLTVAHPQIARNLLMYRYHNLPGARTKAKVNGYEGAMFPWESTDTGEETTPQWSDVQPDGSRIRIWTGDSEQHISTDITYGILQYWRWSGDDDFLRKYGAEIVLDTAVFWGSRVEAKNDRYEISQQIGPDEYHENIDNSVFTNRMVVWHLEQALALLGWLKTHSPADAERLTAALNLTPERLDHWRDVIARMFIPFDDARQIHIQFPGFFDLEYIPVPHYEPRQTSVQAILGHYRSLKTQVIKQADVVMLMALLGDDLTADHQIKLNNWNTYYPRTDHGSSLSPSIHAWVAARLGLQDEAYNLFDHAGDIDLRDNKGNVIDGIHGAASGGLWQAAVFGFCGLHLDDDNGPAVDPHLPEHWKSVSFTVYYRGEKRQFTVTNPV